MNKTEAYNILTQLLSDLQELDFSNKELQEYQEAINVLCPSDTKRSD